MTAASVLMLNNDDLETHSASCVNFALHCDQMSFLQLMPDRRILLTRRSPSENNAVIYNVVVFANRKLNKGILSYGMCIRFTRLNRSIKIHVDPKKCDTEGLVINSQKPNIYGLMRRVPSLLFRNYRFRRYPPLPLVLKCILAVRVSRIAARNRQTPCRGIVAHTYEGTCISTSRSQESPFH